MHFFGQFELDKWLYEKYFVGVRGGFFIECGAFDGYVECTCLVFEKFMGWSGVNIEASPPNYKRLTANRPHSINMHIALSNREGFAKFKHAIHPTMGDHFGNGSIEHVPEHTAELLRDGCRFEEYEIRTITFKSLLDIYEPPRFDLFVLDVEGHEPAVIEGMVGCKYLPRVICAEHGHIGIPKLTGLLEPLGYKFDDSYAHNSTFLLQKNA